MAAPGAKVEPRAGDVRFGPPLAAGSKSPYRSPLDGGDPLTGSRRLRRASWAIWLALLALGFNALVPIHLALDLGEACADPHRAASSAVEHSLEWRLLALAAGHDTGDSKPDGDHKHPICPAFAALGALSGFATVAAPALPAPVLAEALPPFAAPAGAADRAPAAGYRSRAPPLG
jgi:hypothetical protein